MPRHPFIDNLRQHLLESGITIDAMLEATREVDPDGYSRETLRSMENGSRRIQFRAMWAMSTAVGYPKDRDPYYSLAAVRHILDEEQHGPKQALANLESLGFAGPIEVPEGEIRKIPISRRREALRAAARRSE